MGFIRDWFTGQDSDLARVVASGDEANGPAFAVTPEDVPPSVLGVSGYDVTSSPAAPKIDRKRAMQTPAFKRGHDLICGPLGSMGLILTDPDGVRHVNTLLVQPEKNVARSVTMTRLASDMLCEGVSWWHVEELHELGPLTGYPKHVKRMKSAEVQVDEEAGKVYWKGREVKAAEVIRFDSPAEPALVAASRAVRASYALEVAASNSADGTPAMEYFTPTDGQDYLDKADVEEFLDEYLEARRKRSTAYVPGGLTHHAVGWSPEQLQLVGARAEARLAVALSVGVDPEEVGVSTTSRTYANMFDRRKAFLDFTLGMYRQAIEDRLSMGDVHPEGWRTAYDVDAFLRTDPLTRMQTYEKGLAVGAYTAPEIRDAEGKPALTDANPKPLAAVPNPEESSRVS